jgi:hypothetical protein
MILLHIDTITMGMTTRHTIDGYKIYESEVLKCTKFVDYIQTNYWLGTSHAVRPHDFFKV